MEGVPPPPPGQCCLITGIQIPPGISNIASCWGGNNQEKLQKELPTRGTAQHPRDLGFKSICKNSLGGLWLSQSSPSSPVSSWARPLHFSGSCSLQGDTPGRSGDSPCLHVPRVPSGSDNNSSEQRKTQLFSWGRGEHGRRGGNGGEEHSLPHSPLRHASSSDPFLLKFRAQKERQGQRRWQHQAHPQRLHVLGWLCDYERGGQSTNQSPERGEGEGAVASTPLSASVTKPPTGPARPPNSRFQSRQRLL